MCVCVCACACVRVCVCVQCVVMIWKWNVNIWNVSFSESWISESVDWKKKCALNCQIRETKTVYKHEEAILAFISTALTISWWQWQYLVSSEYDNSVYNVQNWEQVVLYRWMAHEKEGRGRINIKLWKLKIIGMIIMG